MKQDTVSSGIPMLPGDELAGRHDCSVLFHCQVLDNYSRMKWFGQRYLTSVLWLQSVRTWPITCFRENCHRQTLVQPAF